MAEIRQESASNWKVSELASTKVIWVVCIFLKNGIWDIGFRPDISLKSTCFADIQYYSQPCLKLPNRPNCIECPFFSVTSFSWFLILILHSIQCVKLSIQISSKLTKKLLLVSKNSRLPYIPDKHAIHANCLYSLFSNFKIIRVNVNIR